MVVAPGLYHEAIDFIGKAITLRSTDGSEVTTIDASGLDTTVVMFISGEGKDSVLTGFTITGGVAPLYAGECPVPGKHMGGG